MTATDPDTLKEFERAVFWRGMLVQRYGAVEFGITHLLAAASLHPEYSEHGQVPFPQNKKIERLRGLSRVPGVIGAKAEAIEKYLAAFEEFNELRHFMVHGIMAPSEEGAVVIIKVFQHRAGQFMQGEIRVTVEQLKGIAQAIQPLSTNFNELLLDIAREVIAETTASGK